MRKILRIMLMCVMCVLIFCACGVKTSSLTAKITQEDEKAGNYDITKEIKFRNDIPYSIKNTITLSTRKDAESYYELMSTRYENIGSVDVDKTGNKVTINIKKLSEGDEFYGMSKSDIIKSLQNSNWTIK